MAETMHCYRHPKRETRVSCATCGRPICTECMRQTDVGIKCPEDARLPRSARAGVMKPNQILWSVLAGLAVVLVGLPVAYLTTQIGFGSLILCGLAGYGAGTFVLRAGGYNGGPVAMIISGVSVALAFFLTYTWLGLLQGNINAFAILEALVAVGFAVYNGRGS